MCCSVLKCVVMRYSSLSQCDALYVLYAAVCYTRSLICVSLRACLMLLLLLQCYYSVLRVLQQECYYSVLQQVAPMVLSYTAHVLQHIVFAAVQWSLLQSAAVIYSRLQCAAV